MFGISFRQIVAGPNDSVVSVTILRLGANVFTKMDWSNCFTDNVYTHHRTFPGICFNMYLL